MYAVFVKLRIDPARHAQAIEQLHESVVPYHKGLPGFVRGTWFGDQETGHGLTVWESEEQAHQMAALVVTPPDGPAQVEHVHVYEVHAQT